jgi:hypothetical protein
VQLQVSVNANKRNGRQTNYNLNRIDFWEIFSGSGFELRIGGYTYHQRFIGEKHMARLLEIISRFLDGGEGVEKVWVGFRVALIFIGIFWKEEKAYFNLPCAIPGAPKISLV